MFEIKICHRTQEGKLAVHKTDGLLDNVTEDDVSFYRSSVISELTAATLKLGPVLAVISKG